MSVNKTKTVKYFSAFSGIGGFELGLPKQWQCVGYSEIEPHAIKIYQKHFPTHKNYGDITKIKTEELPDFDWLVGGFPCQSFSIAGYRRGFDDTRGTLFFDITRIIKAKRPACVLLENVRGLLSHDNGRTYKTILSTLTKLDYDTEALVFDSWFFGKAPRERVYMLAHDRQQKSDHGQRESQTRSLYTCLRKRVRNQDQTREQKSVRDAGRIMRTFARLPDWLDSWNAFYPPQVGTRQRAYATNS